jgi:signal transduction histidine kinase
MLMEPWLERFAQANFRRSGDTAHDLKTPLNVAVLSLELLRMRVRKVAGEDDQKVDDYVRAVDIELRRMGHIFDAFFLLSTPPKTEELGSVDVAALAAAAAANAGFPLTANGAFLIAAHESRVRQALRLFFEGAGKLFAAENRTLVADRDGDTFRLTATGAPAVPELELTKIFKFYYTDPDGHPDLSLATARLIIETYGGELIALEESDKVSLRLSVPPGEK